MYGGLLHAVYDLLSVTVTERKISLGFTMLCLTLAPYGCPGPCHLPIICLQMLGVPSEEVVRNASERPMRYGYGEWLALLQVCTQMLLGRL
jgi:hypothetical protein